MGDQVEEEESGVGGLIPYELLPDDKQTGNHGVIVIDGRELTVRQTSRLANEQSHSPGINKCVPSFVEVSLAEQKIRERFCFTMTANNTTFAT